MTRAQVVSEDIKGAGESVPVGSILDITPQVHGERIDLRIHLTVRDANGEQQQEDVRSLAIITQELFATGTLASGESHAFNITN